MTHLFLDTNIFLHFTFFDQIKWKDLVNDEFKIILAPTVVDELDKHKRNPNSKIANRAKKVLSKIDSLLEADELTYPLEYRLQKPKEATLAKYNLERQEQDDCIIAAILEFIEEDQTKVVRFVTHDTGPRLKSKFHGIQTLKIPEDYLIPNEKTEEEKLIAKLTTENSSLKNRIPKVNLAFTGSGILLKHHFKEFTDSREMLVNDLHEAEKRKFNYLVKEEPKEILPPDNSRNETDGFSALVNAARIANMDFGFNRLSQEQIDAYNKDLDEYFSDYITYLSKDYQYKQKKALAFPIYLELLNTGNAPAEDIDIWLHFPDGFLLYNMADYKKKPSAPKAPYKPKSRFDHQPMDFSFIHSINRPSMPDMSSLNTPSIKKTNSYEVEYGFKLLKHNQSIKLKPLIVQFESFEEIKSFSIEYRLMISNVPDLISGELNVVLTK